ncbi:guanitoxin biosynthesis heme-dependent pre-guanitoxin N-hydroxylase GntA [Methylobacterium sp. A54F]
MRLPTDDRDHPLARAFHAFIEDPPFPCVGAKSALSRGRMKVVVARDITSGWDDMRIYPALLAFICRYRAQPDLFQSFAVVFEGPGDLSEQAFEHHLWARAQSLSDKDSWLGQAWDARVADDPENPHFSLSFAGEAFFIVGLHPRASRPARRFASPVLVFNLHAQFERLRAEGRYEKLRRSILQRDAALAGSVNPMIARHGEMSEARQYSGRAVEADWQCPFRPRGSEADREGTGDVR